MKTIKQILSTYFDPKETQDSLSIPCPKCTKDGKTKELYFYKSSSRVICFRCRTKGIKWGNPWVALNTILKEIGVKDYRILSDSHNLMFYDLGKEVSKAISPYTSNTDFIEGKDSVEVQTYVKTRNLNFEKVKPFVFFGIGGPLKGKISFPLYPSGWQGRALDIKEYKIIKEGKEYHRVFTPTSKLKVKSIVVVEGPFDSLNLYQYGYDSIALLGLNIPGVVNQLLVKKEVEEVFLWLDPDVSQDITNRAIKDLYSDRYNLFVVDYPKEPGDCNQEEIEDAILFAKEPKLEEVFNG